MAVKKSPKTEQSTENINKMPPHPFRIDPDKKQAAMENIKTVMNKKWGAGTVDTAANKADELRITPLPTPSLKLNEILDGGIMEGRIIELFGPTASGKTFLTYQIIAKDMELHPDSVWVWIETEGSFSEADAQKMRVDTNRLQFLALDDLGAESLLDKMEAYIRQFSEVKGLLRGVVVNSVAGLTPADELNTEHGKQHMGLMARMMSKHMRKITSIAERSKCTVIYINQVRDKISLYGGTATCGDRSLCFYASQRIELRKASDSNANWDINLMMRIDVKVHKNRNHRGNPYKSTSMYAVYGKGIDSGIEIAELAVNYGFIQRGGAWYTYNRQTGVDENGAPIIDTKKFNGSIKLLEYINDNPDIKQELYNLVSEQFLRTADINVMEQELIKNAETTEAAEFQAIESEEISLENK